MNRNLKIEEVSLLVVELSELFCRSLVELHRHSLGLNSSLPSKRQLLLLQVAFVVVFWNTCISSAPSHTCSRSATNAARSTFSALVYCLNQVAPAYSTSGRLPPTCCRQVVCRLRRIVGPKLPFQLTSTPREVRCSRNNQAPIRECKDTHN
jgi:hypothetical protein